jgi:Spy/CpxP family protein refolding chaperone
MKRVMKKLVVAAFLSGVVMLSGRAMAEVKPAANPEEAKITIAQLQEKMEKALGLSVEQSAKLKTMREALVVQQKASYEELKAKREALRVELEADSLNRGKIDGLVAEINTLQGKMNKDKVEQVYKVRDILTLEQFKKFKQLREKKQTEGKKDGKAKAKSAEHKKAKK